MRISATQVDPSESSELREASKISASTLEKALQKACVTALCSAAVATASPVKERNAGSPARTLCSLRPARILCLGSHDDHMLQASLTEGLGSKMAFTPFYNMSESSAVYKKYIKTAKSVH